MELDAEFFNLRISSATSAKNLCALGVEGPYLVFNVILMNHNL